MRLITADFLPLLAHFGADNVVAIDFTLYADVAQLVARNLAKVQVAGSTPVVRSIERFWRFRDLVEWPRGEARDCKSRYTGSNPVPTSKKI